MNSVDILIHVHPELAEAERAKVEQAVAGLVGVASASFDKHKHPHALTVVYDPDTVQSKQVLDAVRRHDPAASMVGL